MASLHSTVTGSDPQIRTLPPDRGAVRRHSGAAAPAAAGHVPARAGAAGSLAAFGETIRQQARSK